MNLWNERKKLRNDVAIQTIFGYGEGFERARERLYAFEMQTNGVIIRRPDVHQRTDIRGAEESDTVHSETREHTEGNVGG